MKITSGSPGAALRAMRVDRNLSMSELSRRLGMSVTQISDVENERRVVPQRYWLEHWLDILHATDANYHYVMREGSQARGSLRGEDLIGPGSNFWASTKHRAVLARRLWKQWHKLSEDQTRRIKRILDERIR